MATGTGKTRTVIGLIYRFLKAERFKRILFLVDRTSLGTQALDAFKEAKLEEIKRFHPSTILPSWVAAEAETRVQVATVSASIIGHIRQAALGELLIPIDQRVHKALQNLICIDFFILCT